MGGGGGLYRGTAHVNPTLHHALISIAPVVQSGAVFFR